MEAIKKNNYISIPNPYKKFEFNSKFETIALGEFIEEITIRNNEDAMVWSVTNDKGLIPSDSRFDEKVASDDTSNYKIVPLNGFAYNPARINVGSIAFNDSQEMGCVSPMYVVFKCKNEKILTPKYLYWLLQSENLKAQIKYYTFGSVRQTLNFDDFCKMVIPVPSVEAQERVISEIESYRAIIENTKRAVESWKPYFKVDESWKKLSVGNSCSLVQRGKSPKYGYSTNQVIKSSQARGFFEFDFTNKHYVSDDFKLDHRQLVLGDILINSTGIGTAGRVTYFALDGVFLVDSHITILRAKQNLIDSKYLLYYLCCIYGFKEIENMAQGSSGKIELNSTT